MLTIEPTPLLLEIVTPHTPVGTAPAPTVTTQGATPELPDHKQTDTPTSVATLTQPTVENYDWALHISPAVADEVWWSIDSKAVYYRIENTVFVYDVKTKDEMVTSDQMSPQEYSRIQVANLLPGESYIGTSPSGALSLYLFGTEPSPTPQSSDGEEWLGGFAAQLRLRSFEEDRVIAEMQMCEFSAQWSRNEARILLVRGVAAQCPDHYSYIIDLDSFSVSPIMAFDGFITGLLSPSGFSPNGNRILIDHIEGKINSQPYIYNLETDEQFSVTASHRISSSYWVRDNLLLFLEKDAFPINRGAMWLHNLESGQSLNLIPEQLDVLTESDQGHVRVSPDGNYVAFVVYKGSEELIGLWLGSLQEFGSLD